MKLFISVLFILFFKFNSLYAQQRGYTNEDSVYTTVDTLATEEVGQSGEEEEADAVEYTPYLKREISQQKIDKQKEDDNLAYNNWEYEQAEQKPPHKSSGSLDFPKIDARLLLWFLAAVIVIIIVMQLFGFNFRQVFAGRAMKMQEVQQKVSENIHEIAFEKEIGEAIAAENYLLATKLLYLQSLKKLSDKKMINWDLHKTNHQYEYEIKDAQVRRRFGYVTNIYELVSYGHRAINNIKFAQVQSVFNDFNAMVK